MVQKTVLLTRPAAQNEVLEQALHEQGWITTRCPLTQIKPLPQALKQAPQGPVDLLFFSSANAVHCCPEWPQAANTKTAVHAMGPATAQALRERGWPVTWEAPSGIDGRTIQALMKREVPSVQHGVLITGARAKPWLANSLAAHHQNMRVWEVYARHCPDRWDFIVPEPTQVVLFFNAEAIRHWVHLMSGSRWPQHAPSCFLTTSTAQAALAQKLPWMRSWVQAENPSVPSVLAALNRWYAIKES